MKVCYLVSDLGGCGQYRCVLPAKELVKRGWDAEIHLAPDRGKPLPEADLYVFQRQTDQRLVPIAHELRRKGKVVLGEVDDWFPGLISHFRGGRQGYVDAILNILRACDSVTVSTQFLADGYRRFGIPTFTVRNYIDWEMWKDYEVKPVGRMRVGYMGLWLSHHPDIKEASGIIGPWVRKHPEVRFVVAGGGDEVANALDVPQKQRTDWPAVTFPILPKITSTMDVGLVPLADHTFNKGKSWLKALEYAACGIPAIVSNTPENAEFANYCDQVTVLENRAKDWHRALDFAVGRSEGEWQDVRRLCREQARELSIDRHVDEWVTRFESALDAGPRPVEDRPEKDKTRRVVSYTELFGRKGEWVTYRTADGRDKVDICCPGCGGGVYQFDAADYGIHGGAHRLSALKTLTFPCCGDWRLSRSSWKAKYVKRRKVA